MKDVSQLRGYRMPAEWEPHQSTTIAFPHHRTDWPRKLSAIPHVFAEMARVLSEGERVRLLVSNLAQRDRAARVFEAAGVNMSRVDFLIQRTNRSWTRDTMPLWVSKKNAKRSGSDERSRKSDSIAVKFLFDGWSRYRDHKYDEEAGMRVAQECSSKYFVPQLPNGKRVVLEGGSVDVDAAGTLLTTLECLVSSKRARFSGQKELAERTLKACLGVNKVLWLPQGIVGDDTSGHVDDFARFAPSNRILLCSEAKKSDSNYDALRAARRTLSGASNARGRRIEVVSLPMPRPIYYEGDRLPASYANFYIANAAVLVPVFNDPNDQTALSILADCFRDRPVVGIYARDLVVGLGTLHCSTMQQPGYSGFQ